MVVKTAGKTLEQFEEQHGQTKIGQLSAALDAVARERRGVDLEIPSDDNTIRFAVCGDTQFGSLYEAAEEFRAFLALCGSLGVSTVLHTGDVLDGHGIYRGQEFELHKHGLDAQLAWFEEVAPSGPDSPDVYFITGNHDASFAVRVGVDIGAAINARNPHWHSLGRDSGRVMLRSADGRGYEVMLLHPGGGTAYALSYRPQKTVEQLEGGHKPQMLCIGHYHKAEYIPSYRNVAVIQSGCFQWQTPFMVRGSIAAHVGGWIIEVMPGGPDALYNIVKPQFVSFYNREPEVQG
jgi:hypothetical protein